MFPPLSQSVIDSPFGILSFIYFSLYFDFLYFHLFSLSFDFLFFLTFSLLLILLLSFISLFPLIFYIFTHPFFSYFFYFPFSFLSLFSLFSPPRVLPPLIIDFCSQIFNSPLICYYFFYPFIPHPRISFVSSFIYFISLFCLSTFSSICFLSLNFLFFIPSLLYLSMASLFLPSISLSFECLHLFLHASYLLLSKFPSFSSLPLTLFCPTDFPLSRCLLFSVSFDFFFYYLHQLCCFPCCFFSSPPFFPKPLFSFSTSLPVLLPALSGAASEVKLVMALCTSPLEKYISGSGYY